MLLCLCVIFWIRTTRCPNQHVSLLTKEATISTILIVLGDASAMVKHVSSFSVIDQIRRSLTWRLLLWHYERVWFGTLLPTSAAIHRLIAVAAIKSCMLLLNWNICSGDILSEKIALRLGLFWKASWLALSPNVWQRLDNIGVGVRVHLGLPPIIHHDQTIDVTFRSRSIAAPIRRCLLLYHIVRNASD